MTSNQKVALVTGGSRGIGAGIAKHLAVHGYDIALTYVRTESIAREVAADIEKTSRSRCLVLQASLEDEKVPEKIVRQTISEFGHIDLLVNNAGVTIFDSILDMELEDINFLINLNFKSYLLMIQAVARHMREADIQGNIINITSSRSQRAYPGDMLYGGLKAGINRAVESIALDLAPYGIRVNSIAPGAIKVRDDEQSRLFHEGLEPRIPLKRVGTPLDIAQACLWLASDQASYLTGITLRIDGGLILPGMPERIDLDEDIEKYSWGRPKKKS